MRDDETAGNESASSGPSGEAGSSAGEASSVGSSGDEHEAPAREPPAEPPLGTPAFSDGPGSFTAGPAFFSSPAGALQVATETAAVAEEPVTPISKAAEEAAAARAPQVIATEIAPEPAPDDWDDRQLCIDGGCIGVLDRSGACRVCGKVDPEFKAPADRPASALRRAEDGAPGSGGGSSGASGSSGAGGSSSPGEGDEWDQRQLCEDGACIGVVIGGKCNTCGRAG